jgi:hypothetical protein
MRRILIILIGIVLVSISCSNQKAEHDIHDISENQNPIKTPSPSVTNTSTLTSIQVRRLTAVAYTPVPASTSDYVSYDERQRIKHTATGVVVQTARATILNITPAVTGTSIYLSSRATQDVEWSIQDTQRASITKKATPDPPVTPTLLCKTEEECLEKSTQVERDFYESFRANVINRNQRAVAGAFDYPRVFIIDGIYKVIENEDDFIRYYDQIITEKVINAIIDNPFDISMRMGSHGWMVDAGTIWFSTYYIDYPNSYDTYGQITGLWNGIYPDDSITTQTPSPLLSDQDLHGQWMIVDILDSARSGEWYPFPNKELYLGEIISIEPGKITLLDQTCTYNSFYHRSVVAEEYFEIIHYTSAFPLGIMNQVHVEVVETGCGGYPLWNIIVKDQSKIFIPMEEHWSVHYLELERIN